MSLPARISFSQIGIFVSIFAFLIVRGFFVLINIGGPFWTQVGGYLSVAFPLGPVIVLGFAACVIAYAFSYLGLWMMDNNYYILGVITILLSVIIIPGGLAVYSWFGFTVV
ncbi:MAG: hypothetical protein ACTSU3_04590 [Candidatus Thorarchaeota archaeon]